MKSKKFLVVLMAALMALAMVACNNNEPAPTPDPCLLYTSDAADE